MKALAVIAIVAAAGAVVVAYRAGAPEARSSAPPCRPAAAHTPAVGKVERTSGTVFQGKRAVKDGAKLLTNGTLCTADGRATFLVTPIKRTSCEMRSDGRLRLYPPKQTPTQRRVVIRFEDGKTYCGTGKDADDKEVKYDARKGQVRLLMKDPLFAVETDPRGTIVQVELGYLEVSRRFGEGAVIIGTGQQVTVAELAIPGKVTRFEKTAADQDAFDALRPKIPVSSFARPDATDSPTLRRIFSRRSIVVGVDPVGDKEKTEFVRLFFGFLAKSWDLRVVTREASTRSLLADLKAQKLDIAVTDDAEALTPFDTLPLFAAPRVWFAGIVRDDDFLASLRQFVRTAVTSGDYANRYRSTFRAEPPLDALRPILFP